MRHPHRRPRARQTSTSRTCAILLTVGLTAGTALAEVTVRTTVTRGLARAVCVPAGPAVDGTLDDPLWQQAARLELGQVRRDEPSPLKTVARVLFDDRFCHVAVECDEPDTAGTRAAATQPDGRLDQDDRVEIFLCPDVDRGYRHLSVNPIGTLADTAYRVNDVPVTAWDARATVKTRVRDGHGWIVTAAIPLAGCDAYVGRNLSWGFNVARHRPARGSQPAMRSSWAVMPLNDIHQPHAFGRLRGIDIPERPDGVTKRRAVAAVWPADVAYLREEIADESAGPDEACVNIRIANSRWPDCYSNQTAIRDIFRIEGVEGGADQDKALALWKWFRILVSPTYGGYCYEADAAGNEGIVFASHKILTVYGHHMCDGQSWAYVPLWRAAGYIAFDECHWGHTIASLRYRDDDGQYRFHDFDPQGRFYWWDEQAQRVSTWTMPLLRGLVHRHFREPRYTHTLRTSLRPGETLERSWDNEGHLIQVGPPPRRMELTGGYAYRPGRTDGIYAICGQEVQTLVADTAPQRYAHALAEGSANTACSPPAPGNAALHPMEPGRPARFIYRLPSPYVTVAASCQATLVRSSESDVAELSLSTDGGLTWKPFHTMRTIGTETVRLDLGTEARAAGEPHVYTAYEFLIKGEFASDADPAGVGLNDLTVTVGRQLNKRALPNLMPGENVLRVAADRLAPGHLLEVQVAYSVDDQPRAVTKRIASFPFYFSIDTGPIDEAWPKNYDRAFNVGRLRMCAIRMRLIPGDAAADESLPALQAAGAFRRACPHPIDLTSRKVQPNPETDPMQTSGFFPQSTEALRDPAAMQALIEKYRAAAKPEDRWRAAEDLGRYPEAIDFLLDEIPGANIDLLLHLCKALAQIKDLKAIEPLLARWENVPAGSPGTRYIPDVLAAIGDPRVVPELVRPLKGLRFDYRFHIAHALGVLGGDLAVRTLREMAADDPFPAVRQYADEMYKKLQAREAARRTQGR